MPADATEQLRDLAAWVDEQWIPQDPARLRGDPHPVPAPPEPRRVPTGRILAVAACLVLVVGLVAVVVRARDTGESLVVDEPAVPDAIEIDGAGWTATPELAFRDRSLALQAPAVWTGSELLLVGALAEGFVPGQQELPSEGLKVFETPAYDPATDTWHTYPAPPVRMSGVVDAVWTGTEVLVVSSGGLATSPVESSSEGPTPTVEGSVAPCAGMTGAVITVASLDPATGTWTVRAEPTVQAGMVSDVVWDGTRAWLVFGDACVVAYDPATDTYADPIAPDPDVVRSATAASPTPPRVEAAVLSGTELLLGFSDALGLLAVDLTSGAARDLGSPPFRPADLVATDAGVVRVSGPSERVALRDPATGRWRDLPKTPLGSRNLSTRPSWTGSHVLVWGGSAITGSRTDPPTEPDWLTDGALLDPATGTWTAIPAAAAELGPFAQSAWAGDRLVVWWGGNPYGDPDGVLRGAVWQP